MSRLEKSSSMWLLAGRVKIPCAEPLLALRRRLKPRSAKQ